MYGIFTYIWLIFMVNVGEYAIHGDMDPMGYSFFLKGDSRKILDIHAEPSETYSPQKRIRDVFLDTDMNHCEWI